MLRPIPIRTQTLLSLVVALCAVVFSVMRREARQCRGCAGPGDHVVVEVLEALPGHSIEGKHRVAADGTIDLGPPYGRIDVNGLTYRQIKVRVVGRLRRFLNDATLGLTWTEQVNGIGPIITHHEEPADVDRVFTDVELPNSEGYSTNYPTLEAINSYLGFESEPHYECGLARMIRLQTKSELGDLLETAKTYLSQTFIGPQLLIWTFLLWRLLVTTWTGFGRRQTGTKSAEKVIIQVEASADRTNRIFSRS